MPHIPTVSTLNANSVGIINAIRNSASIEYYNAVPEAVQTNESIRLVGESIMAFQPRMNEFISALVNRIAKVVLTSKMYRNPFAFAKKGKLEFGETIEEIFVDIAKVQHFDPANAVSTVFQRTNPDVSSMFHSMNVQSQYPVTIEQARLKQAFLSMDGITQLISYIVNSLYSAANYDEYIMTKFVIAKLAITGALPLQSITAVTDATTATAAIKAMKSATNKMKFMSSNYTIAGVKTFTDPSELYVFTTADFDAETDVDVLAKAFNMDRTNWMGQHVQIDSFAFNDDELARLAMILEADPGYTAGTTISSTENAVLATITAVVMDKNFYQIYDVLDDMGEIYNPKGKYWNYFLDMWRIYSASPFCNVLMFASGGHSVTSVTVNGATTGTHGTVVAYTATLVADPLANKGVVWSVAAGGSGSTAGTGTVTIDQYGKLTLGADASGVWVVTAKSVADSTKSGTKSITVS